MKLRPGSLAFAALLSGTALLADADPVYTALRAARPTGPAVLVENLILERDVYRFTFVRGAFQFLPGVEGRITGAAFVGEGSWQLTPADEGERRHLALLTGQRGLEVLEDRFEALVLLFTDATEGEIRAAGREGTAPAGAAVAWDDFRSEQRKTLDTNLQIRILADVLRRADPKAGVFFAAIDGRSLPAGLVMVDPGGLDWFPPGPRSGPENSGLWMLPEFDRGFWYLARRRADTGSPPPDPASDAESYVVDSTISESTRLSGTTTLTLRAKAGDLRVVPIELFDKLRIREAAVAAGDGAWTPIAFIQEKAEEDSDAAVVLAFAPPAGALVRLRISYEGKDVLRDMGEGTFAVGARQSWYPNLGSFRDLATFDLTYRVPKGRQVVSVGERISDKVEGDAQVSVWKAERPIRVAGFNYGKFRMIDSDDKDSGMKLQVYSNTGTPDVIAELNLAMRGGLASGPGNAREAHSWAGAGLQSVDMDAETFARNALADGVNSARIFTAYFGPVSEKHVAITQQAQWFFGQSWPSLVFLPYLAALDGTQRRELGLGGTGTTDFVDLVGPHELAHQWWGHSVGWASYRDTWLSEGFAEFSASLVMQRTLGPKRLAAYWEQARKWILEKPPGSAVPNDEAGPLTLGTRLMTRSTPSAYQAIVYLKGAYVLQMLRMLMWDPRARTPDGPFIALMTDFARSFAGRNPSTRDFQTVVERHMTPTLDVAKTGKLDWFFRQWVDGTEVPRYTVKVDVQPAGNGEYKLSGAVTQDGVSKDFVGFLPLYLEYDKAEVQRLAVVSFVGNMATPIEGTIRLPKAPRRVVANAMHDVLTRD